MPKKTGKMPGILLYRDTLETLQGLPAEEAMAFITAMYDYAVNDISPTLSSTTRLFWPLIRSRIDLDREHYELTSAKRKYANYIKKCRINSEPELSFEQWQLINECEQAV